MKEQCRRTKEQRVEYRGIRPRSHFKFCPGTHSVVQNYRITRKSLTQYSQRGLVPHGVFSVLCILSFPFLQLLARSSLSRPARHDSVSPRSDLLSTQNMCRVGLAFCCLTVCKCNDTTQICETTHLSSPRLSSLCPLSPSPSHDLSTHVKL